MRLASLFSRGFIWDKAILHAENAKKLAESKREIQFADNALSDIEYEIFFKAYKAGKRGPVTITVQSAYVRDEEHMKDRPQGKPIGFYIILFNTLNNKLIKAPN